MPPRSESGRVPGMALGLAGVKAAFGQELLLRITFWSVIAGSVGFAMGFFGPIVLAPRNNLGPLLGIFLTGPAGVLLGPALGVAIQVRRTTLESLPGARTWLVLGWFLVCGYYAFSGSGMVVAARVAVGLMLAYLLVGVALAIRVGRSPGPSTNEKGLTWILVVGAAVVILLSLFPPIRKPSWGRVAVDAGIALPRSAFLFDGGFDGRRHVPTYAVDVGRWFLEVLVAAVATGVAGLGLGALVRRRR